MIKYTNYLILIFMNININIRNKTKLVEKLRWYTCNIYTTLADNYPILQNLVPKKVETQPFDQNDKIYEFSNLNSHEYE